MAKTFSVLLFHTSSHAIRAEKLLEEKGTACKLIPVPRHLSSDCGVCVRVRRQDRDKAEKLLEGAGVEVVEVHDL
ncbi:unnamed protein product [marine sediment metagenome]|uniref:Putative Se/S carrier protein-like domain-containing protein n=1 Tax=marine sediment metagenome TaxID=412755 RepID=X0RNT6_9ZZZZ